MPTIRDDTIVAAGATVANILAGSQFEFMRVPSHIAVYVVEDSAGADGLLNMDVSFGNTIETDSYQVPTKAATLGPNVNEDQAVSAVASAGDRIVIRMRNTDGTNAKNSRTLIKITPLL